MAFDHAGRPPAPEPPPEPAAGRLAVAAIVRNEGPYLVEWIAHHRALGVGRFFIADNGSTDETTATLAALAAAGIVDHLPFPTVPGRATQPDAYNALLARFGAEADWIAFIDADEFLVPARHFRSLAATLAASLTAALTRRPGTGDGPNGDPDIGAGIGAIAVNWAVYGSAGQTAAGDRGVAERFPRRAPRAFDLNCYCKLIVRPHAVSGAILNPHLVPLKRGWRTIQADGRPLVSLPGRLCGLSARLVWAPLRINHYAVKSWDEFCYRKRARGRAAWAEAPPRPAIFFAVYDRNEVTDPMPAWLVRATRAEARRIEATLRARATGAAPSAAPAAGRSWRARLAALFSPGIAGAVEAVEIHGDTAFVRGWALAGDGRPAARFRVTHAGRPLPVADLVRIRRYDIVARHAGAALACGFVLRIAWPAARAEMAGETAEIVLDLAVEARDGRGRGRLLSAAGAARLVGPPPLERPEPLPHLPATVPVSEPVSEPAESRPDPAAGRSTRIDTPSTRI